MDFDFCLEEDRVQSFLQNKLEEIKAKNDKLRHALYDRQQFLRGITESCNVEMDENNVRISPEAWKKVFNDKYVFGVTIENNENRRLSNLKTVLTWDSPEPVTYQVSLYEQRDVTRLKSLTGPSFICPKEACEGITNSLKKSDTVEKLAHLIVTVNRPQFTDQLSYKISGNIIFRNDDTGRGVILKFPQIELSSLDSTNQSLYNNSVINGDIKDIAMLVSATEKTNLLLIFPDDWPNSFDSTFEILCSFTRVNAKAGCRKLFLVHNLSPCFDGSLLVFHAPKETCKGTYKLTTYTRNEDNLLSLLHHLNQNVPGVLLVPEVLYENYLLQHPERVSEEEEAFKLKECLKKEIHFMTNVLHLVEAGKGLENDEYYRDLSGMEKDSNIHYVRLLKAISRSSSD